MTRTLSSTRRAALALLGVALAATGLVTLGASSASATDSSMFGQVNASRAAHGRPAYAWNAHLADVAAGQAARMAGKRELYHNPNLASDVGNFRWVGENVGYGPSSGVIENAFMNSPEHKANILDTDYTQIGIASVRDSKGRLWVAQVFRQPTGGSSSQVTKKKHKTSSTHSKPRSSAPKTRSTTHSGDATATPAPAAPAVKPAAKHRTTKPAAAKPAPVPTLAQRVSYARSQAPATTSDPLSDSLAFAATMHAVAG